MRAPVVESHAGKAVEGPAAGKAVIERAAQSCELTRASHKSDALYVVAEAEGEYEVQGLGRGPTAAISGNRTANFDAATLDRFKARSERIIYEQCLGDAVTESNRGSTLQQAGNHHSQTPHFSKPPEVNGRVEIKLPRHRCDVVNNLTHWLISPQVNGEKAKIVRLLEHARFKRSDVGICLLETTFVPASNGAKAKVRVQAKLALTSVIFRPMEQRSGGRYRVATSRTRTGARTSRGICWIGAASRATPTRRRIRGEDEAHRRTPLSQRDRKPSRSAT